MFREIEKESFIMHCYRLKKKRIIRTLRQTIEKKNPRELVDGRTSSFTMAMLYILRISLTIQQQLSELRWECSIDPPDGPNLASLKYHLSRFLRNSPNGVNVKWWGTKMTYHNFSLRNHRSFRVMGLLDGVIRTTNGAYFVQ